MAAIKLTAFVILFFFLFVQCGHNNKLHKQDVSVVKGLKDYYENYFRIGVAVTPGNLSGNESNLMLGEFNSLTPENAMKMGPIHPKENEYFWTDADSIVNFAQHHGLKVRGHNLCWHEQTPGWLFKGSNGKLVTKRCFIKKIERPHYYCCQPLQGKNLCMGCRK
ncbi:MAG: endo-1,4-beta-xylanase [Ginsengibacter sp.]